VKHFPDELRDSKVIDKQDPIKQKFEREFKGVVEHKIHQSFKKFKAVSYVKEPGLAIYHIKYEVDQGSYVHASIAELKDNVFSIGSRYRCTQIEQNKRLNDIINFRFNF